MATLKQKRNSPAVWREAIIKLIFVTIFCMIFNMGAAYFFEWYKASPVEQGLFAIAGGIGNFFITFIAPQTTDIQGV